VPWPATARGGSERERGRERGRERERCDNGSRTLQIQRSRAMMYTEKGQEGERMAQELRHRWRCAGGSGTASSMATGRRRGAAQAQEWPVRRGSGKVLLRCREVGQQRGAARCGGDGAQSCGGLLCPGYTASSRSLGSIGGERGGRRRIL
jgi:hypothetical protein